MLCLVALVAVPEPRPAEAANPVANARVDQYFEPGRTAEGDFAYAPSSFSEGDTEYHFYCGNERPSVIVDSIFLAQFRKVSGKWQLNSDEVVFKRMPGAWDGSHVCDPSVTKGKFFFDGTEYRYAMFYTGTRDPKGNGTQNSVGVAYSNNLTEWVRYPQPVVARAPREDWGVGQPSAITMPNGEVYLFYTRSNPSRVAWRTFRTTESGEVRLGSEKQLPVAGTQRVGTGYWAAYNVDVAYDPASDRFWVVKPAASDSAPPSFIATELEVLWIDGDSLRQARGMWHSIGTIGPTVTGEAKNHNAGLHRKPNGHLLSTRWIRVNATTSPTGPFPLSFFGYNLSKVSVPIGAITDPFDARPGRMNAINPYRAVDTRKGYGGKLGARETRRYRLRNTPAGATAVTLNVTVDDSLADGFVSVWDCDGEPPETSNLNYVGGDTRANQVTVPVNSRTKEVCFFTWQRTHLVIDVFGWFGPAGGGFGLGFAPRPPARMYDSRTASKFAAGEVREFSVGKLVPGNAAAVTFNLTTTEADTYSFTTVWPCDKKRPTLSSLNTVRGFQDRSNQVTVKLSGKRKFCVYSSNPQHLIIDMTGSWVPGGDGGFIGLDRSNRWLDSRRSFDPLGNNEVRRLMPEQDQTIVGQLTATRTVGAGHFALFECDAGFNGTSTVNFVAPGETASVAFFMRADRGGICVRSVAGGDLILDITGYIGL